MSVIGRLRINEYLKKTSIDERLIVTPLLNGEQIGESSIDIRLGNDFITTRRGNLHSVDPSCENVKPHKHQIKHYINFGERFYLHPNELVLAGTLEYFRLPNSLAGYVTSRSSWGREGLVIATAVAVHPGFTGCITLELINLGEVPLVLYPGISVAQIVLNECVGGESYNGRFGLHTDAQHGNVDKDKKADLNFWTHYNKGQNN